MSLLGWSGSSVPALSPLKRSGKAITIDGAFSEAYGDHGYTLVLEADRIVLAKHHHFESVDAALHKGVDIVPSVQVIRTFDAPRLMGGSDRGESIRLEIGLLEALSEAYRRNRLHEGATSSTGRALRSPASAQ